ncbi:MAG: STAS domain-containing protein [Snodgrassella sp.]|nr:MULTISPECIES: STAS domain-containing protein [Snodgrassella]MCO6505668.1 STAS domain-containing protein [Snodgrassella sp.]MCO6508093.1 STAS domain-containing protein [Snodgrassella sp.]MCO6514669.1 STAS domain-containing protein [Snodgrassella sp.]MCO6515569.1 STAS domain-containing protein [Snodgrassella sp.]MCO6517497.1 STAS domain-containing protein [Snodgrassella sp.]
MQTTVQGKTLMLHDKITMSTVGESDYKRFCNCIQNEGIEKIDVSGVTEADSACVALLIAAKRLAHRQKFMLHITGVPSGLITLMALYGVEESLQ